MNPMQEEEEFDPRRKVLDELVQWAKLGEADEMRERYGKPPRPPPPGEDGAPPEAGGEEILGVETTEDGEAPPPGDEAELEGAAEEIDPETLKAILAAMGG